MTECEADHPLPSNATIMYSTRQNLGAEPAVVEAFAWEKWLTLSSLPFIQGHIELQCTELELFGACALSTSEY
jgi:hypothetical protein